MGMLNWLRRGAPKGYKKLTVTFTPEESEAMERNLVMYGKMAEGSTKEGMQLYVLPKVIESIRAQGLTE